MATVHGLVHRWTAPIWNWRHIEVSHSQSVVQVSPKTLGPASTQIAVGEVAVRRHIEHDDAHVAATRRRSGVVAAAGDTEAEADTERQRYE